MTAVHRGGRARSILSVANVDTGAKAHRQKTQMGIPFTGYRFVNSRTEGESGISLQGLHTMNDENEISCGISIFWCEMKTSG
jgi:hypothetical protein